MFQEGIWLETVKYGRLNDYKTVSYLVNLHFPLDPKDGVYTRAPPRIDPRTTLC